MTTPNYEDILNVLDHSAGVMQLYHGPETAHRLREAASIVREHRNSDDSVNGLVVSIDDWDAVIK